MSQEQWPGVDCFVRRRKAVTLRPVLPWFTESAWISDEIPSFSIQGEMIPSRGAHASLDGYVELVRCSVHRMRTREHEEQS